MNYWFECKVTFEKETSDMGVQRVTEVYLVDALNFTEAEKRIIAETTPFVFTGGELLVANIKRVKIAEIFRSDSPEADRYYRCKVNFITLDEKAGKEKKTAVTMLVQSSSLPEAVSRLEKEMETQLGGYEISTVTDTAIMDIYRYEAPAQS